MNKSDIDERADQTGWVLLIVQSLLIGCVTGLVVGLFRYFNDHITLFFVHHVGHPEFGAQPGLAVVIFAALFLLAVISILLLRWERLIGGSGIPQVELMIHGDLQMVWWRVLITKFTGALASLAGGLSLGREGPCIMMGSSLGVAVGRLWHTPQLAHGRRFLASGGGAGLAAAFGAPIAGFCFIFEEVKLPFEPALLLSCLLACFSAVWMMQGVFGFPLVFPLAVEVLIPGSLLWAVLLIGVLLGFLGVIYNRLLIAVTLWADATKLLPMHLRVFIPFFISGLLLYFYPTVLVGFGVNAIDLEHLALPLTALVFLLIIKLLFSVLSYSTGVAGGLLMPILLIGAIAGANIVSGLISLGWVETAHTGLLMAMAMAALFGSSVRAPLTGAFLMIEMTGSYTNAVPIILAAYIASYVANKLGNEPVYDTLRERSRRQLLKKAATA